MYDMHQIHISKIQQNTLGLGLGCSVPMIDIHYARRPLN